MTSVDDLLFFGSFDFVKVAVVLGGFWLSVRGLTVVTAVTAIAVAVAVTAVSTAVTTVAVVAGLSDGGGSESENDLKKRIL